MRWAIWSPIPENSRPAADYIGNQGFQALDEEAAGLEIFLKELSEGEWAICALNTDDEARELTLPFHRFHLRGEPQLTPPKLRPAVCICRATSLPAVGWLPFATSCA